MNKLNKKHLWYLATVCGFTIGFLIGGGILRPSHPWSGPWLELIFWAFPAAGAGFGMGFGQWLLLRHIHKNAYLWIPITTIGVVASMGGLLLLLVVAFEVSDGSLPSFFMQLPSWFVPLTIIAPLVILVGPFCQWLIIRGVTEQPSKELLKMSVGWILAILSLFIFVVILMNIRHVFILTWLLFILTVTLPGLIFARTTNAAISRI